MRALANVHSSVLDFIENTRLGAFGFRLARLALLGMVVFVGSKTASGQFLAFELQDVVFIAVTALVFLGIAARWEAGIAAILATTTFIAYYDVIPTLSLYHFIPEIPVLEVLRLTVGQGILLFLLGVFVTSMEVRTMRERLATPLTAAVILFMVAIALACFVGLTFGGVRLGKMVETARSYSFYLMFFVTLLCLRDRRSLNVLMVTLMIMAVIVAVLMGVQFAVGEQHRVFLGNTVRVEAFGGYAGRILPPGAELIWMAVPFVIARIPIAGRGMQRFLIGTLAILLGGLLLTFTRSMWMGALLSMTVMAILGRGAIRRGVLRMFLALGIFVGVLLVVLQLVSTESENYMAPYVRRFTSIFDPESYREGTSAGARAEEIRAAWPKIVENPWLGIGVGGFYNTVPAWDDASQAHYMRPVSYIHNAYVLVLTQSGVIGFTTCMAMFVVFFARARRIFQQLTRPEDRALVMAGIGAIASLLLGSLMQPSLWHPPAVPCIGVIFGLVEVTRYFADRERREARLARAVPLVASRRRDAGWQGRPVGGVAMRRDSAMTRPAVTPAPGATLQPRFGSPPRRSSRFR
jgi:O-antigen ligase